MNRDELVRGTARTLRRLRGVDAATVGRVGRWLVRLVRFFAGHFVWKLTVACVDIAWDVVSRPERFAPGIIELPLRCRTELEITMLANLITLTPGTLTLAVRREPATLWVHAMYSQDREHAYQDLRDYEYRMLTAMRPDARVEESDGTTHEPGGAG